MAAAFAVLLVGLVATATVTVRRSFPQYGGEVRLPGLAADVTVIRDDHGVPQIYAGSTADLFRAQGYVHAQERFWEMDFRRHITAGRLAELFGADQVATDTYVRTLGWRRVAEAEWNVISTEARRHLNAYAEGVNAWLAQHGDGDPGSAVSLEYALLGVTNRGYRIEPWTPVDSLSWLKAMAWDLRGNMGEEIDRATLFAAGLTREQIDDLYPAYPYDRNRPILDGGDVVGGAFVATGRTAPGGGRDGAGGGRPAKPARAVAAALGEVGRDLDRLPA
ncbi:MAG TPA: penicillin acylase family protein, partial [Pilimelia sp.]|nr:penicillin acylase family protein [Pilimelia sp.]